MGCVIARPDPIYSYWLRPLFSLLLCAFTLLIYFVYYKAMDTISKEKRSALMARIRSKDTKPELVVRSILHRLGFRFRIHRKDLPGKPDIVLPRHHKIILVQGCFWHGHTCILASKPKSNQKYWQEKIKTNKLRDRRVKRELIKQGWSVFELWECEIRKRTGLIEKIEAFMRS